LQHLGFSPVLVGARPVLGQAMLAAGTAALAHLARSGVSHRALAAALSGFGAAVPQGLPAAGAPPWDLPAPDILHRWLGALANEGLRLLDQGIARRPSDIDLVLFLGHGFPRWRCGPMHQADRRGLLVLRRDLRAWAAEDPIWTPAPLLDRLIRDGLRLADLDARDLA
jgi:3-hydroxyacyl-CoA dehydrogenase